VTALVRRRFALPSAAALRRRVVTTLTPGLLIVAAIAGALVAVEVVRSGPAFAVARGPVRFWFEASAMVALTAAGAAAAWRRSPSATALLLLAALWPVREWANPAAPGPLVFTAAQVLGTAWLPVVGWLAFAYPSHLPARGLPRGIAGVLTAAVLGPALVRAVSFDPVAEGCADCPTNLLLVAGLPTAAATAGTVGFTLQAAACAVVLAVLVRSVAAASPAMRLVRLPVAAATGAVLALGTADAVLGVAKGSSRAAETALTPALAASLVAVAVTVSWERVRAGAARRRIARLMEDLSSAPRPGRLREELARLAHDPHLGLAFPVPGGGAVDVSGSRVGASQAQGPERRSTSIVGSDGRVLAVLTHRPGVLDDASFRDAVVRTSRLVLRAERLQAELMARVAELRESRARLVASFDYERRRLERDLHDGLQQRVVALLLSLRLAQVRRPDERLATAVAETQAMLEELRELAHGLYPAALAEEGLASALDELRLTADITVRVTAAPSGRYPEAVEATVYAVVRESLDLGLEAASVRVVATGSSATDRAVEAEVSGRVSRMPTARALQWLEDRVGAAGGTFAARLDGDRFQIRAVVPCG
jgi:signal transduction histidine kinase